MTKAQWIATLGLVLLLSGCSQSGNTPNKPVQGSLPSAGSSNNASAVPSPTLQTDGGSSAIPVVTVEPLAIPPLSDGRQLLQVEWLKVRPDGQAFALEFENSGALMVWRSGDKTAVSLQGLIVNDYLAWSPDGFYYAAQRSGKDVGGDIYHYQWSGKDQLLVDHAAVQGTLTVLGWDPSASRLLFADKSGLHAVTPDGKVTPVAGSWGGAPLYGSILDPQDAHYVTTLNGTLNVCSIGQSTCQAVAPLATLGDLNRVSWSDDGRRLSVEARDHASGQLMTTIYDLQGGTAKMVVQVQGQKAAVIGQQLWYVADGGLSRLSLPNGKPQQSNLTGTVVSAASAAGHLYLVQPDGIKRLDPAQP